MLIRVPSIGQFRFENHSRGHAAIERLRAAHRVITRVAQRFARIGVMAAQSLASPVLT